MRSHAVAVVLLLGALARSAYADDPEARTHFESGRALARSARWAEAAEEFRRSLAIESSVGGLLNLGNCLEHLGQLASAVEKFRDAETLAGTTDPERAAEARKRAAALLPSVPKITVDERAGGALTLDGRAITSGVAAEVDPGLHTVVARTPGARERSIQVRVAAGERVTVVVPEADASADLVVRGDGGAGGANGNGGEDNTRWRTVGAVTAGVGLAGVVVGSVFGALALARKNDLHDLCPDYPRCPAASASQAADLNDSAGSRATVSTVGLVAGGALLVGGIVLWLVSGEGKPEITGRTGGAWSISW